MAWLGVGILCFSLLLIVIALHVSFWLGIYLGADVLTHSPVLPFPSSGMDAQPVLVIVCSACLMPPSSSAPPLACKVCFLMLLQPHTSFPRGAPPLPPSLPPRGGTEEEG